MADLTLHFITQFAERLIVAVGYEDRIITETVRPSRSPRDRPAADSSRNVQNSSTRIRDGHHAYEPRPPRVICGLFDHPQQRPNLYIVAGIGPGKSRGENTRCVS